MGSIDCWRTLAYTCPMGMGLVLPGLVQADSNIQRNRQRLGLGCPMDNKILGKMDSV